MENKPKTSSYKRLKPYIKGFQVPFVLAIVGAIISAVITVIGPDKLKEITNLITDGITEPSLAGLIPRSDSLMARSISAIDPLSNGEIKRTRASGTVIEANWLSGVGAP